jgi:hypothetical protein
MAPAPILKRKPDMTDTKTAPADKELQRKGPKKFDYTVRRDFWDSEGRRTRKGAIVSLTAEDAMDLVESGQLTRIKG